MTARSLSFYVKLKLTLLRLVDNHEGQALTEYALILALVAIVAIAALRFLSGGIKSELTSVATSL
jgi:pilus assembly protein Flp/PilA